MAARADLRAAAVCRRAWGPDMDIFENKNHNGLIYNGSKPVRTLQDPQEGHGNMYGYLDQGAFGNKITDISVRNLPPRDLGAKS